MQSTSTTEAADFGRLSARWTLTTIAGEASGLGRHEVRGSGDGTIVNLRWPSLFVDLPASTSCARLDASTLQNLENLARAIAATDASTTRGDAIGVTWVEEHTSKRVWLIDGPDERALAHEPSFDKFQSALSKAVSALPDSETGGGTASCVMAWFDLDSQSSSAQWVVLADGRMDVRRSCSPPNGSGHLPGCDVYMAEQKESVAALQQLLREPRRQTKTTLNDKAGGIGATLFAFFIATSDEAPRVPQTSLES